MVDLRPFNYVTGRVIRGNVRGQLGTRFSRLGVLSLSFSDDIDRIGVAGQLLLFISGLGGGKELWWL